MFIFIFHVLKPENRRISDFKLTTVAFQGGSYVFFFIFYLLQDECIWFCRNDKLLRASINHYIIEIQSQL